MQSMVELYFRVEESKAVSPSDIQLNRLEQGKTLSLSQLYKLYVQRLYNYGMHACNDPEFVRVSLQELFVYIQDHREILAMEKQTIPFYLFKGFREILNKKVFGIEKLSSGDANSTVGWSGSGSHQMDRQLSTYEREAIFLKLYGKFSYQEVAAIMDLNIESVYNLVSQAVEILRQQVKEVPRKQSV